MSNLSSSSCYFVNDVGEDNVLVISIRTHFLPLRILSESDIVAEEGVTDTEKIKVSLLVRRNHEVVKVKVSSISLDS